MPMNHCRQGPLSNACCPAEKYGSNLAARQFKNIESTAFPAASLALAGLLEAACSACLAMQTICARGPVR